MGITCCYQSEPLMVRNEIKGKSQKENILDFKNSVNFYDLLGEEFIKKCWENFDLQLNDKENKVKKNQILKSHKLSFTKEKLDFYFY